MQVLQRGILLSAMLPRISERPLNCSFGFSVAIIRDQDTHVFAQKGGFWIIAESLFVFPVLLESFLHFSPYPAINALRTNPESYIHRFGRGVDHFAETDQINSPINNGQLFFFDTFQQLRNYRKTLCLLDPLKGTISPIQLTRMKLRKRIYLFRRYEYLR